MRPPHFARSEACLSPGVVGRFHQEARKRTSSADVGDARGTVPWLLGGRGLSRTDNESLSATMPLAAPGEVRRRNVECQ